MEDEREVSVPWLRKAESSKDLGPAAPFSETSDSSLPNAGEALSLEPGRTWEHLAAFPLTRRRRRSPEKPGSSAAPLGFGLDRNDLVGASL